MKRGAGKHMHSHTQNSQWGSARRLPELEPGLCDSLEEWDGAGGGGKGHVYTYS